MLLDAVACAAALVDAVKEEEHAARHHRLPEHGVQLRVGAVLDAQVRVHPVPEEKEEEVEEERKGEGRRWRW